MASTQTYTVRFGIEMLMAHFLEEDFLPEYPAWVAGLHSGEYYVNMIIPWYFATALCKQWDAVIPVLLGNRLDKWTHNKAIQKAVVGGHAMQLIALLRGVTPAGKNVIPKMSEFVRILPDAGFTDVQTYIQVGISCWIPSFPGRRQRRKSIT